MKGGKGKGLRKRKRRKENKGGIKEERRGRKEGREMGMRK